MGSLPHSGPSKLDWQGERDPPATDDGTYTYLGRSDDMINSSGMRVSPAEVEAHLRKPADVALAAVVAVADESDLDKTVACVVRRSDSTISIDELITFCRDGMANFKCPRTTLFVDELLLTATGNCDETSSEVMLSMRSRSSVREISNLSRVWRFYRPGPKVP